ncbi:MAG: tRNA lysidine(34) synthetase TilS, partial [Shimia sp.]
GDSMALLHLARPWAHRMGIALKAVTIDHGLRPGSAEEAALVARECATLGVPHRTERWTWDGRGNLHGAARDARLAHLGADDAPVVLAHTQDDQAETVLMAIARAAGVDGLSAMRGRSTRRGVTILRPLLGVTRAALRHHNTTLHIPFVDDPSNTDPAYERVRVRDALAALSEAGIDAAHLSAMADRARDAADGLHACAAQAWEATCRAAHYEVTFDRAAFAGLERETRRRLLHAAIAFVAPATKRPRGPEVAAVLERIAGGGPSTLGGAAILPEGDALHVLREVARTEAVATPGIWDGRFRYTEQGLTARALGPEGAKQIADKGGIPIALWRATPGLFDGADLIVCPRAGLGPPVEETLILPQPFGATVIPR